MHHVGWQVKPGCSIREGKTLQRPQKNVISVSWNPLSQQHQQRCVQRDGQKAQRDNIPRWEQADLMRKGDAGLEVDAGGSM